MSNKRKRYNPEFKAKVALAALKNEETMSDLAARFGVHPTMIASWKRTLLDGAPDIFDQGMGETGTPIRNSWMQPNKRKA
jgi:transposase